MEPKGASFTERLFGRFGKNPHNSGRPSVGGKLYGKRIVITGAGGGIATEAIRLFKQEGAKVAGIDLNRGEGTIQADIRDAEAVKQAVAEAEKRLGGIDILINNAGIGRAQDAGDFPDEQARLLMEIHLFGTWNMTAAAMPALLRSNGHVINVSSGLALANVPYTAAYSASKRAIAGYSDVLRMEYKDRIKVTTLYPAYIKTAIHDNPAESIASLEGLVRMETVDQAARALLKACLHKPRDTSTSRMTGIELWFARHLRRTVDNVLLKKSNRIHEQRGKPTFLRDYTEKSTTGNKKTTA